MINKNKISKYSLNSYMYETTAIKQKKNFNLQKKSFRRQKKSIKCFKLLYLITKVKLFKLYIFSLLV